jgi:hypothetical protein
MSVSILNEMAKEFPDDEYVIQALHTVEGVALTIATAQTEAQERKLRQHLKYAKSRLLQAIGYAAMKEGYHVVLREERSDRSKTEVRKRRAPKIPAKKPAKKRAKKATKGRRKK